MADISITAANVLKSSNGVILRATSAATITAGSIIYQLADLTVGLADSNGTTPANSVFGVAINGATSGQPVNYVATDTGLTFGGTTTVGLVLYLSNTPGAVTSTYADLASGSTVIALGVATSSTVVNFNPTTGGVK